MTTDEALIERWADEYERGEFTGTPGPLTMRSKFGRPRLSDEPMVAKTFRLRRDQEARLEEFSKVDAKNPSELMREAWDEYTRRRDLVAA